MQPADLVGPRDRDAVADVVEVHGRPAAVALGLVERGVGLGEQRLALVTGPQRAQADARREARLAQRGGEAARDGAGALGVGAAEHERELVAADAIGGVAGADVAQDGGHAPQQRVAVRMAVAVVEELEVVEVDHDDAQRVAVARGRHEVAREVVLERALVGQVGEPVAARAAQRDAVAADERAPADEPEHERGAEQGGDDEQHDRAAHVVQLAVEEAVVARDLEGVAAVRQVDRHDELEVAVVLAGVRLAARVAAGAAQGGGDGPAALVASQHRAVAGRLDRCRRGRRARPRSRPGGGRSRRAARASSLCWSAEVRARPIASSKLAASARCSTVYVSSRRRWSWSRIITYPAAPSSENVRATAAHRRIVKANVDVVPRAGIPTCHRPRGRAL